MTEYQISTRDGVRLVKGKPVKFKGVKLFIHRRWYPNGRTTPRIYDVTELTTGMGIGHGDVQADAIADAINRINRTGVDQVTDSIAAVLADKTPLNALRGKETADNGV